MEKVQVVVIGAGPVGLFVSSMLRMLGLSVVVFESQDKPGGQCAALYPEKPVYGIPALPKIKAGTLVERLYDQAVSQGARFVFNAQVEQIKRLEQTDQAEQAEPSGNPNSLSSCFEVSTPHTTIQAQALVITAGAGAFVPNRIGLPNEHEFEGRSLFYSVQTPTSFSNKKIVIAGGGNAAIDWALELCPHVQSIDIVHRRNQFRCNESTLNHLQGFPDKVRFHTPFQISVLHGQDGYIQEISLQNEADSKRIPADCLLVFFGIASNLQFLNTWGVNLDKQRITIRQENGSTNIPGIFAAGDIVTYDQKINILATGFGEAAKAAYAVKNYLDPQNHQKIGTCHSQLLHL